jgi:hypothetical protein
MTSMDSSTPIQHQQKSPLPQDAASPRLQDNPHWQLAQRVVAGSHFSHSPLLSKFLLFVVAETLEGRGSEITEHQIGVRVFGRPSDYRTLEDNIVRNYARQLRKRLAEYFAGEGKSEPLYIDIPLGGYVPVFVPPSEHHPAEEACWPPAAGYQQPVAGLAGPASAPESKWKRWLLRAALATAYSAALICLTWFLAARTFAPRPTPGPVHLLWATLFADPANSYIVPSDAGFNLLEDLSHRSLPLAEYINGRYLEMPLPGVDAHSAQDLRSQQLSNFIDLQIVAALARLPEDNPQRVFIRFPRDLRFDDLKHANAVIIGSMDSNPWASIAEPSANFRIVSREGMQGATIVNLKPQKGEAASYASHWNEPAHETFALIAFLSNLSGSGHLLFLQGLDAAGTQAAAEMLFHNGALDPILRQATRPDGSLRNFEILLRATSIEANATGTQVIASRIY